MTSESHRIQQALNDLGYDSKWIEYEFLSPQQLLRQHEDFLTGDDYCTETDHLRMHAFYSWLKLRALFRSKEIEQLLELISLDECADTIGWEILRDFLDYPFLTDEQFERIASYATEAFPGSRFVQCSRLIRQLRDDVPSESIIRDAVASNDGSLQNILLERGGPLPQWALLELSHDGANKKVRNRAGQYLAAAKNPANDDS